MSIAWRTRQWWGHPPGTLMAVLWPQPRELTVLAMRTDPLRVVVTARAPLAQGDVRGTRIRLVGTVAAALEGLRRTAQLPVATPLVALLDACADPGAVPGRTARAADQVPTISRGERLAYERAAHEAGFSPVGVLALPDAIARRPATPTVRRARRRTGPPGADDLLVTAAVAAVRGELRSPQPEADDAEAPAGWMVEAVGGVSW